MLWQHHQPHGIGLRNPGWGGRGWSPALAADAGPPTGAAPEGGSLTSQTCWLTNHSTRHREVNLLFWIRTWNGVQPLWLHLLIGCWNPRYVRHRLLALPCLLVRNESIEAYIHLMVFTWTMLCSKGEVKAMHVGPYMHSSAFWSGVLEK